MLARPARPRHCPSLARVQRELAPVRSGPVRSVRPVAFGRAGAARTALAGLGAPCRRADEGRPDPHGSAVPFCSVPAPLRTEISLFTHLAPPRASLACPQSWLLRAPMPRPARSRPGQVAAYDRSVSVPSRAALRRTKQSLPRTSQKVSSFYSSSAAIAGKTVLYKQYSTEQLHPIFAGNASPLACPFLAWDGCDAHTRRGADRARNTRTRRPDRSPPSSSVPPPLPLAASRSGE